MADGDAFPQVWASDPAAEVVVPTAAQIAIGFVCGAANMGHFNWLFQRIMQVINGLGNDNAVPTSRRIDTNGGIGGGGDLSIDRTHALDYDTLELVTSIANEDEIAIRIAIGGAHKRITRENLVAGLGGGSGGGGGITSAANVNTLGVGVYHALSGSTLQFRGVTAGDGMNVAQSGTDIVVTLADYGSELTFS